MRLNRCGSALGIASSSKAVSTREDSDDVKFYVEESDLHLDFPDAWSQYELAPPWFQSVLGEHVASHEAFLPHSLCGLSRFWRVVSGI